MRPELIYPKLDAGPHGGPRSEAETVVQVVCHAGDYCIDLQIEPEFETAAMAVVGQVVRRTAPGEPLAGAAVRLMARKKPLVVAQTNSCGEFCLVAGMQRGLKLYIEIERDGMRVGIPLDKLTNGFRI